jgi:hypothetical protein
MGGGQVTDLGAAMNRWDQRGQRHSRRLARATALAAAGAGYPA